jgi:hypothetical protein
MTEPVVAERPSAPSPAPETEKEASSGSWGALVPGVLIVVLLAATAVGAVALQRHDTAADAAPQIGWMRQGCAQWAASAASQGNPVGTDWCASMTSWMNDQMGQGQMGQGPMGQGQMGQGPMGQGQMGQGPMVGSMMWQTPQSMQATCQQWASSGNAPAGVDAPARCAQMVEWMTQHMGDWTGWMARGPMMVPSTTS